MLKPLEPNEITPNTKLPRYRPAKTETTNKSTTGTKTYRYKSQSSERTQSIEQSHAALPEAKPTEPKIVHTERPHESDLKSKEYMRAQLNKLRDHIIAYDTAPKKSTQSPAFDHLPKVKPLHKPQYKEISQPKTTASPQSSAVKTISSQPPQRSHNMPSVNVAHYAVIARQNGNWQTILPATRNLHYARHYMYRQSRKPEYERIILCHADAPAGITKFNWKSLECALLKPTESQEVTQSEDFATIIQRIRETSANLNHTKDINGIHRPPEPKPNAAQLRLYPTIEFASVSLSFLAMATVAHPTMLAVGICLAAFIFDYNLTRNHLDRIFSQDMFAKILRYRSIFYGFIGLANFAHHAVMTFLLS